MRALAEHHRAFGYAAAASLTLHALVLSLKLPSLREALAPPPPEPPLIAHLVEPPAAALPPPPPAPAPQPLVEKQSKPKPKPRPRPTPKPAPIAKSPLPAPAPPPPLPEAADEPNAAQADVAPAPPAIARPPLAAVAPPPRAPAPAPDPAAALADFRQQLVALAVRYKRYPLLAIDNGWTGDVVVHVRVTASGAIAGVRVKTSSGHEVLDAQALEMFRRAAPEVGVPAALRGKDFSVEVRAVYNLRERPG